MANMLLVRAPGTVTTPIPGAPVILDPTVDPFLQIDGEALAEIYGDGDTVSDIEAFGAGPIGWRRFDVKRSAGAWNFPTLKTNATPTGLPALLFEGSEHIANGLTVDTSSRPTIGDRTIFAVLKVNSYEGIDDFSRVVGGITDYLGNMQFTVAGADGRMIFTAGTNVIRFVDEEKAEDWIVLCAAYSASDADRIKLDEQPVETVTAGNQPQALISIGTTTGSSNPGGGFNGEIACIEMYAWQFSVSEIETHVAVLRERYIGS